MLTEEMPLKYVNVINASKIVNGSVTIFWLDDNELVLMLRLLRCFPRV